MLIGVGLKALFVCNDKEEWNLLHKIFGSHFSKIELMCVLAGEDARKFPALAGKVVETHDVESLVSEISL